MTGQGSEERALPLAAIVYYQTCVVFFFFFFPIVVSVVCPTGPYPPYD